MTIRRLPLAVVAVAMSILGSRAALPQPAPLPTLTKAFLPPTFAAGATTSLVFTLSNASGSPAVSNVGFVDTLPAGIVVAAPAGVGGTCANAAAATTATSGSGTVSVTGLMVPAGVSTCTVTLNVTNVQGQANASCALLPAAFTNGFGNVQATNATNAVSDSCVVVTGGGSAQGQGLPALYPAAAVLLGLVLALAAARALTARRTAPPAGQRTSV